MWVYCLSFDLAVLIWYTFELRRGLCDYLWGDFDFAIVIGLWLFRVALGLAFGLAYFGSLRRYCCFVVS